MTTIPAPLSGPDRWAQALVAAGVVAAAVGLARSPESTWPDLLMAAVYLLFAALSGLVFLCIHYLSGAVWSAGLRRVAEAIMSGLPLFAALLALTLLFGRHALYPWSASSVVPPLPPDKAAYFRAPFVLARMAVVLAAWLLFGRALRATSLAEDRAETSGARGRLVRQAAAFMVVFAFTFSFASVDWIMSLEPRWTSTIFAIYAFAGVLVSGVACVTLTAIVLRERGPFRRIVSDDHLHDLGKLLFAFTTFWAYIWLAQYLLVWYANLPDEVPYYVRRTGSAWLPLFLANLVVNWVIPFVVLLPRAAKRSAPVLKAVCLLLLAGRWLDLYLLVVPAVRDRPAFALQDILVPLGCAGLLAQVVARGLARAPLVPPNDPDLQECA